MKNSKNVKGLVITTFFMPFMLFMVMQIERQGPARIESAGHARAGALHC